MCLSRVFLPLLFVALCLVSLLIGAGELFANGGVAAHAWLILGASRLPRLAALALTGAGLSVCGVVLQHVVRNRFVEPGTTGALDAAKLGILASLVWLPQAGTLARMGFALVFCLIASGVYVALVARVATRLHSPNAVLAPVIGLVYGAGLSAVAEFYAWCHNILQSMQGWMLGDFSRVVQGHYEGVYVLALVVALVFFLARRFTVLGMGRDAASSLGLGVASTLALGLLLASVTVAVTVITVGAIPFVGLVVPNLVALRHGENLAQTLPLVALGGATLLVACDVIGRLLLYPFEVPIGLTAAAIGGALFLGLVARTMRQGRVCAG